MKRQTRDRLKIKLIKEWNELFQSEGKMNILRAKEILKIWESQGKDIKHQKEILENWKEGE